MHLNIEYNHAIEFINSVFKYANNKFQETYWNNNEFNSNSKDNYLLDFSPSKDIKEWLTYVDNNISPFMKNDMDFVIEKIFGLYELSVTKIIKDNLDTPQNLIEAIRNMPSDDIIRTIYEAYNVDVPFSKNNNDIEEAIRKSYDSDTAALFIQVKKYPEEYKTKVLRILEVFYEKFYKPFQNNINNFLENKIKSHNEKLMNNPIEFLNIIGLGDYTKLLNQKKNIRIFLSYVIDVGMFYLHLEDTFIMIYGFSMEERLNKQKIKEKYKNLFKALSDEKRLDIIKLTSKRPWYNKELADYFNLTSATLSYHLNLLLDLGILNFEPSINNRYYYTTNKENLKLLFDAAYESLTSD